MSPREPAAPLFVLGAPRSGTSLLYKALCLHPQVAYISNWVRRFPALPQLAVLNRVARRLPGLQRRAWFRADGNAYVYDGRRSWALRAVPMPVEGEPVYARCGVPPSAHHPPGVDRDHQRTALRTAFAAVQHYGGGRLVVSKRIANNHRIRLLHEAFPAARFVEIVRDGRAVAYSLSRVDWWPDSFVGWYGGSPRQWEQAGGDPWEIRARDWVAEVQAIEEGLAAVPEESVARVRYEHLAGAPAPVLRELAAFAGLPDDRVWRQRIERLQRPPAADVWRRRLTPRETATIERIQAQTLRRRGYDV